MVRVALAAITLLALTAGGGEPVSAASAASDEATRCVFNTMLLPGNEVRPVGSPDPVDSTAIGHAQVKIRQDATVEYKVFILNKGGETFVAGHIHRAPAGVNGSVVVPLFGGNTSEAQFVQHAEAAITAALADEICGNPAGFYVNYHTTQDPGGAVRGQLD